MRRPSPALDRARERLEAFNSSVAQLLVWIVLALVPRVTIEPLLLSRAPGSVKWGIVGAFVAFQLFLALSIATGRQREIVLTKLHSTSIVAPLGYSLGLAIYSIAAYAGVLSLLHANGAAGLVDSKGTGDFAFTRLQDLFLWQLLDEVPVVNLNEAFVVEKPFTYSTPWAGLLMLVFKVSVIGPVIGSLVVWGRLVRGRDPA